MTSLLAAALLALPAVPAVAQSETLLDCSSLALSPSFRERLADAMLRETEPGDDPMIEELANVSSRCAAENGLQDAKAEAYFNYSIARLPRDAFIARLGGLGISTQVVDAALDFGIGRSNPIVTGDLSPAQIEALVTALADKGVETEQVAESTWQMVGAYTAATSLMWQALRNLQ